jgi:outer membrane receptor protein involved in Fe transport
VEERYAGIKGAIGDHFNYSAKVAMNILNNQPLFVNDTASGKSFISLKESELKVFNLGGELGYTVGEKFSVVSNLSLNRFRLKDHDKAWGLLPLEWKTTMKVQVLKDLYVNSTLFAFDGPWSNSRQGRKNLPAAMDLSAGLEFKIVKNLKLWAQFNNIFNKEYQRWNQYPVYGFNFLGGVVFSFAQNN